MRRSQQNGIALIVTLIMLSIVTLMAVVFLAISRRENASVIASQDLAGAKLAADAALARAEADLLARIMATTNIYNYDLMVSTNYVNLRGFQHQANAARNLLNVSYTYANGAPLNKADQLQNIANLELDPRPPVYVTVPGRYTNDFRYYLDFNRNGLFEPSGWGLVQTPRGNYTNYFVGDPQWIGILEHPDQPHSDSNRFTARYAYIVLPAGKSLDLNFIYNSAKLPMAIVNDGYLRNEGVGSWELNLAAFLRDLNPTLWPTYSYRPVAGAPNGGAAFIDAHSILRYRYMGLPLASANAVFGPARAFNFAINRIDQYSDGPLLLAGTPVITAPDVVSRPWSGSDNPRGYYDVQELFHADRTSASVAAKLASLRGRTDATSRYTFYRLLAQMGVDSAPAESNRVYQAAYWPGWTNRINLNYPNLYPNGQTNFGIWNSQQFFDLVADRMLRLNINPVVATRPRATNYFVGEQLVRPGFNLHDIQIYHVPQWGAPYAYTNNEYTPTVHRLLQLAANIYEAISTNAPFPTVFHPIFYKTRTNIVVKRYVAEPNDNFLLRPWLTPQQIMSASIPVGQEISNMVYGVPVVIGARKGLPNFNEFTVQTAVEVSRRIGILKRYTNAPPPWQTNQMYVIGISNVFGMEAWNSYTQDFRLPGNRRYLLLMTNVYSMALSNTFPNGRASLIWATNGIMSKTIAGNDWPGRLNARRAFQVMMTNMVVLPSVAFAESKPHLRWVSANSFEPGFAVPHWTYYITNMVQYALVDPVYGGGRVLDLVNLGPLVSVMDITAKLAGDTSSAGNAIAGRSPGVLPGIFWDLRRAGPNGVTSPTVGVTNQLGVSLGNPVLSDAQWRSWNGDPVTGQDKDRSIDAFRVFMGLPRLTAEDLPPPSSAMEAPFTPTRAVVQTASWQVNDPLVHYLAADLTDPTLTDTNALYALLLTPGQPLPPTNLGQLNDRYRPWGGNPNKNSAASASDPTAYDLAFKDPGVRQSDDWDFPTNKYPNIGWLGRVHRGTPWQTVYLKSRAAPLTMWLNWAGALGTHPTNDWKLMELFTTAPNANAARGLLAVNQTNLAAWSAVLSSVAVLSNSAPVVGPRAAPAFTDVFIQPTSPQLQQIVNGIIRTRNLQPNKVFETMGAILATPELSDQSPYLNLTGRQPLYGLTDEAYERIPQQILSLLKPDETRVVVYAFGQALKPADRSLVTSGSFYNLCTNYEITGEAITKTVLRIEPVISSTNQFRAVVESYQELPPD